MRYLLITVFLVFFSFDWSILAQASVLLFLCGVGFLSVAGYSGAVQSNELFQVVSQRHPVQSRTCLGQLSGRCQETPRQLRMDKRLTGATIIDQPMQEILDLTFRDCVEWWYYEFLGTSPLFLHELRQLAQHVVVAFANKSKETDWVPFFTQRLVDDFATHLRLYRAAQEMVIKKHDSLSQSSSQKDEIVHAFFDVESELDSSHSFRSICTSSEKEQEFLRDLSEILLYLLLPPDDFHNKILRLLARELIVGRGLLPTIEAVCDSDYVNQTIAWLCYDWAFTSEAFADIVRHSLDLTEVSEVDSQVDDDIGKLRAKDRIVADSKVKQKLSSLKYLKKLCCTRQKELQCEVSTTDVHPLGKHKENHTGFEQIIIPLSSILSNSSTFCLFSDWIEFNAEGKRFLNFWQNIEGFRVSAEQMEAAFNEAETMGTPHPDIEAAMVGARYLYDQYITDDLLHVEQGDKLKLKHCIDEMVISPELFGDIQKQIELILELKFYPLFRDSDSYQKCLEEIDWDGDFDDVEADDDDCSSTASSDTTSKSVESLPTLLQESEFCSTSEYSGEGIFGLADGNGVVIADVEKLEAEIQNAGVCRDSGQQYGMYAIHVTRHRTIGEPEIWVVPRRYSDFHDLQLVLKQTCHVTDVHLPGKRAFTRLNRSFLEKRRKQLNDYLQVILDAEFQAAHVGASDVIMTFLSRGEYLKVKGELARKVDSFVSPLRHSVRTMSQTVKAMPSKVETGIDAVSRALKPGTSPRHDRHNATASEIGDELKLKASLLDSDDTDDNIPLRILLLLMDEVFDLKTRSQWLRRRIISLLKEIIKATFGDRINKKIIKKVETLTSSEQISEFVRDLKDSMWPDGVWRTDIPERDAGTKARTRVAAKAKMLGTVPDDLKRFIGADTARDGVCRVFDMFQHSQLNKRLVYVVLEDLLVTVFPDNKFPKVFQRLHSLKS